jgi:hypothetical protein
MGGSCSPEERQLLMDWGNNPRNKKKTPLSKRLSVSLTEKLWKGKRRSL